MIVEELVSIAKSKSLSKPFDVRIGLFYTGVMLEDGRTGVASTPRFLVTPKENSPLDLTEMKTDELLDGLLSPDPLLSAVGLATLNAVMETPHDIKEGDMLDYLQITNEDIVGMVGYFSPFVERIKNKAKELYVFERVMRIEGVYPDWAIPVILPKCSVIIITGSTILNKTIDFILEYTKNSKKVAIVGPSTPLHKKLLEKAHILSGIKVLNGKKLLDIISQGGGTRLMKGITKKVNLLK